MELLSKTIEVSGRRIVVREPTAGEYCKIIEEREPLPKPEKWLAEVKAWAHNEDGSPVFDSIEAAKAAPYRLAAAIWDAIQELSEPEKKA